jgi:hypothetical protein
MRTLLVVISLLSGCQAKKPIEWYPRVSVWNNSQNNCGSQDDGSVGTLSFEKHNICRPGKGLLLSMGIKL